jgi:hypothetical protein
LGRKPGRNREKPPRRVQVIASEASPTILRQFNDPTGFGLEKRMPKASEFFGITIYM